MRQSVRKCLFSVSITYSELATRSVERICVTIFGDEAAVSSWCDESVYVFRCRSRVKSKATWSVRLWYKEMLWWWKLSEARQCELSCFHIQSGLPLNECSTQQKIVWKWKYSDGLAVQEEEDGSSVIMTVFGWIFTTAIWTYLNNQIKCAKEYTGITHSIALSSVTCSI